MISSNTDPAILTPQSESRKAIDIAIANSNATNRINAIKKIKDSIFYFLEKMFLILSFSFCNLVNRLTLIENKLIKKCGAP